MAPLWKAFYGLLVMCMLILLYARILTDPPTPPAHTTSTPPVHVTPPIQTTHPSKPPPPTKLPYAKPPPTKPPPTKPPPTEPPLTKPPTTTQPPTTTPPPTTPPPPPPPPSSSTTPITLVTAYYPLPNSKHSQDEYMKWITFFLASVASPVVAYTSKDYAHKLLEVRGSLPITVVSEYNTPFDIDPNVGMEDVYMNQQHQLDRERARHNGNLYAIWNAKAFMLSRVSKENIYNSKYFFWVDIGCFRENHPYRDWPNIDRVEQIWSKGKELQKVDQKELLLLEFVSVPPPSLSTNWGTTPDSPIDRDMVAGTFFGGPGQAVQWWETAFYSLLNKYLKQGKFIGKDQIVMNALAVQEASRIIILPSYASRVGDTWFYFQPWLSKIDEFAKKYESEYYLTVDLKTPKDY